MNKTFAILTSAAFGLASGSALADDRTPYDYSTVQQAKMRQEADAMQAKMAKMTPEERAAAQKASDAEALRMEDTLERFLQFPQNRNNAISKSAADSEAAPSPLPGFLNTPEGDEFLREQSSWMGSRHAHAATGSQRTNDALSQRASPQ